MSKCGTGGVLLCCFSPRAGPGWGIRTLPPIPPAPHLSASCRSCEFAPWKEVWDADASTWQGWALPAHSLQLPPCSHLQCFQSIRCTCVVVYLLSDAKFFITNFWVSIACFIPFMDCLTVKPEDKQTRGTGWFKSYYILYFIDREGTVQLEVTIKCLSRYSDFKW